MNTTATPAPGRIARIAETLLFGHRGLVVLLFALASLLLGWQAMQIHMGASFEKMVPASHPYIRNYLRFESELRPLGNNIRIAVENTRGDIYDRAYLDTLKKITDEVFFIPGVDRGALKSLWTANVMWVEVTEEGFRAGPIIAADYDGSDAAIAQLRQNVLRSGRIGSLVAADQRSSLVMVPLLELDPDSGQPLDYAAFAQALETLVRDKYEGEGIRIHMTGFAKIIGDLVEGVRSIATFFAITFVLTTLLVFAYSRCWRSTTATILCCSLAVVWQIGLVRLLGYQLDPYSILVPFLTFAIGVSHAVQNVNLMASERHRGRSNLDAAKATFRLLFVPGTIALLCDVVGFSTLMVIDIGVIRELAISASIGVAVIILTKMLLLPVLMSWIGVSAAGLANQARRERGSHGFARALSALAEPRWAKIAIFAAALVFAAGWWLSRDLQIGDLDPGAPELRAQSRYNRDNAWLTSHYTTSADVFVVMVQTPPGECGAYPVANAVERLKWTLLDVPGVESVTSLFDNMKTNIAASYGGDLRWYAPSRNRYTTNSAHRSIPGELYNADCSMLPVLAYLSDHKAQTLTRVSDAAQAFADANGSDAHRFTLAAGNAGIEAATNRVIEVSEPRMLALVYGIIALLVWWEFKSFRVMLCLMLPLYITAILCEAIMARLGLGVKVATLPVIALGVGIGVDYGIYIYNRLEQFLKAGLGFRDAYFQTLRSTGAAVALTGVTLALGTLTWVFSEIKFQADMGLLLTFMFLWNMVGAIVLIPALAVFLAPPAHRGAKTG